MITLAFEIIKNTQDVVVPKLLSTRGSPIYSTVTFYLSIAFLLITFARMSSAHFLVSITKSIYKNRSIEKVALEEYPLTVLSSFSLLLNFLICGSCLLYLTVDHLSVPIHTSTFLAILYTPLLFLTGPYLCLTLVEFITGEQGITKAIKLTNWVVCKLVGILFTFMLMIWIFNSKNAGFFAGFLMLTLSICYIYRIFRGMVFAFSKGISWYYIILYFCMFEIIPMYPLWMLLEGKL